MERSQDRATREVFDKLARSKQYQIHSSLRGAVFDTDFLVQKIQSFCQPPLGPVSALEVGSGLGDKTTLLFEILCRLGCQSPEITGIDFSAESVAIARTRRNHKVHYEVADFFGNDLGEKTFDYVFLAAVFHHFVDMKQGVLQISKHLKPGGIALILNTFYPEPLLLRLPVKALQRLYRLVLGRGNAYYNDLTVAKVKSLIEETHDLNYLGAIPVGFPASLGNTHLLLAQRPKKV